MQTLADSESTSSSSNDFWFKSPLKSIPHHDAGSNIFKLFSTTTKQTKDLKLGYKLDPKTFSTGLQTFISINKFKTPFWWSGIKHEPSSYASTYSAAAAANAINGPYHNPIDSGGGNNIRPPSLSPSGSMGQVDDLLVNDEIKRASHDESTVNASTSASVTAAAATVLNDDGSIFNQQQPTLIGYNKVLSPPCGVITHQHAGNFELNIAGGLFHLSKNRYKLSTTHQL